MKMMQGVACGSIFGLVAVIAIGPLATRAPTKAAQPEARAAIEVPGRTRCMLSRRGIIAAAILRPVVEVLVGPGDRVKKGQPLIKLYDQEVQAKLRVRQQDLKSIQAKSLYSQRNLDLADNSRGTGAIPQRSMNDLRAAAMSNEALVQAAEAELAQARAELNLYTVSASIDGEIAWLDVSPGTVSWPGAMMWGEIVDLRELDIRCDLGPIQAEQVAVGQPAEVLLDGKAEPAGTGKVVFIGKEAERSTGLVPVVIRMANPEERLRAEVEVKVRIRTKPAK
jgi:RND family efflux transporter MFP subunit